MKLRSPNNPPTVDVDHEANRSVVLHIVGLILAMYPNEARALADVLHDAAEEADTIAAEDVIPP